MQSIPSPASASMPDNMNAPIATMPPTARLQAVASAVTLWLRTYRPDVRRVGVFLLIGSLGMALNSAVTAFGHVVLDLHYLLAAVVATEITSACCFLLVEAVVFADRDHDHRYASRLLSFLAINNGAFVLRGPMMYVLTTGMGVHYLLANLASIAAFTVARYAVSTLWIWRSRTLPGVGTGDGSCRGEQALALRR